MADKVLSEYVRARDKKCVTCGSRKNLTNGHLISRGKMSVRYNLRNNNCQCAGCNLRHEHYPHYYEMWFLEKYGADEYMKLCQEANQIKQYKIEELEALIGAIKALKEDLR